jgi:radical SAM protein with 4Fe4S-binding SPASM domain
MNCNAYQHLLQRTFDRRIPLFAHWELTYACNLACRHCYANVRDRGNELSLAEIRTGLRQLADAGGLFLAFTGGEVFCRTDLFDVLAAARDTGFALRLLTNGTLIDTANAARLAGLGVANVEITLYAMAPGIHDAITGVPGSHRQTLTGIANCRGHGLTVAIKSPLMRDNLGEFEALSEFARDQGVELRYDLLLVPADDGAQPMPVWGLSEGQLVEFIRRHSRGTPRSEPGAEAGPRQAQHPDPPPTPVLASSPPPVPEPDAPLCGAGASTLCVSPYGDVFPCLAIRRAVGNLRDQTLRDIWAAPALDDVRRTRHGDLERCATCALAVYCSRCPGVALAESGSWLGCSESARLLAAATRRALELGSVTSENRSA